MLNFDRQRSQVRQIFVWSCKIWQMPDPVTGRDVQLLEKLKEKIASAKSSYTCSLKNKYRMRSWDKPFHLILCICKTYGTILDDSPSGPDCAILAALKEWLADDHDATNVSELVQCSKWRYQLPPIFSQRNNAKHDQKLTKTVNYLLKCPHWVVFTRLFRHCV